MYSEARSSALPTQRCIDFKLMLYHSACTSNINILERPFFVPPGEEIHKSFATYLAFKFGRKKKNPAANGLNELMCLSAV